MEKMQIQIDRVSRRKDKATAWATILAADARIAIAVRFRTHANCSGIELWQRARDEILRYLDPA